MELKTGKDAVFPPQLTYNRNKHLLKGATREANLDLFSFFGQYGRLPHRLWQQPGTRKPHAHCCASSGSNGRAQRTSHQRRKPKRLEPHWANGAAPISERLRQLVTLLTRQ